MKRFSRKFKTFFGLTAAGLLLSHAGPVVADTNQNLIGDISVDGVIQKETSPSYDTTTTPNGALTPQAQRIFDQKMRKGKVVIAPPPSTKETKPSGGPQGGSLARMARGRMGPAPD